MATKKYYDQRRQRVIDGRFDDHVITLYHSGHDFEDGDTERLTFRRGRSSTYLLDFMRQGSSLIVRGDLGDAIYNWGRSAKGWSLEGFSTCGLSYFASKCVASEKGRGYRDWDGDYARKMLKEHWQVLIEEASGDRKDSLCERRDYMREWGADQHLGSADDWMHWLQSSYGGDGPLRYDDLEALHDIGDVIAVRCQMQLQGLRAAIAKQAEDLAKIAA